jgi:hypothetical protein
MPPLPVRLLLRCALLAYPRQFRVRYGAAMREAFEDGRAAARLRGSFLRHDARVLTDLLVTGLCERLHPTLEDPHAAAPTAPRPATSGRPRFGAFMDNVIQDIRFALRSLVKQPSFALVALVALAVGIGANTAIFSVVNGVILRPLPYADPDVEDCGRGCHTFTTVARLTPGTTVETVNTELGLVARRLEQAHPDDNTGKGFLAEKLLDNMVGGTRRALYLMLGAVGMVLLIACANAANVLLIRASGRSEEVAVRFALGAGRGRIVRQLLIEAAVLAAAAGALGLLLAGWGVRLLLALAPDDLPRLAEVRVDGTVLAFAVAVAAGVSLLFGLAPALRLARAPLSDSLRRGRSRGIGSGGRSWSRTVFLTAEVALSLVLLLGAGLLQRSFAQLTAVDLGYDTNDIVRFALSLPEVGYETPEGRRSSSTPSSNASPPCRACAR